MKTIEIKSVGDIKNELRKYKSGAKLDINQFNQVARLAWLGKVVLQPLDPEDETCRSFLMYVDFPEAMAEHVLSTDEDLIGVMHILDAVQGEAITKIMEQGFAERMAELVKLQQRDFYFDKFYQQDKEGGE